MMVAAGQFFDAAIRELDPAATNPAGITILDFGCGEGGLVHALRRLGYAAHGCDINDRWPRGDPRFTLIEQHPYRIGYDSGSFDYVISTSVLEHVQNKAEVFREMRRVLKPGGIGMHLYPSKWYLPYEPHLHVPLVNYFWPRCPRWWLALWALLGIRNEFQKEKPWREVVELNARYAQTGVSYWSNRRIRQEALATFGNCEFGYRAYMRHAGGGAARVLGRTFGLHLGGRISQAFRMSFLVVRKAER